LTTFWSTDTPDRRGVSPDYRADIAEHFAHFAAGICYDDLPEAVIDQVKILILDTFGNAIAGHRADGVDIVYDRVREWGGRSQSTVWMRGARVPAPHAALVNGVMSHALEFDDLHDEAHVHCLAPVLPAALATAELVGGINGREFLTAVAVGVEVMCRLGLAVPREKGWHYTPTYGVFGVAAAAARLLRLDPTAIENALGVAYSSSAGTKQCVIEGRLVKRVHPGLAAQAGLTAALFARSGLTGPREVFDGRFGYFAVYEGERADRDQVLNSLGEEYLLRGIRLKPYPCCGFNHAAIDAALAIAGRVAVEDIEQVVVALSQTAHRIVGAPFVARDNPGADAQFSVAYTVAAALIRGTVFLDDFEDAAIRDPAVVRLAQLVKVEEDPFVPVRAAAPATVTTRDGRIVRERAAYTRGGPEHPLTAEERATKLRRCLAFGGLEPAEGRADRLGRLVASLEDLPDVAELLPLLLPGS
jgi:2-methylcitrate dehydratase PrpD